MLHAPGAFVRSHTTLVRPPLVPEIALHLAEQVIALWETTASDAARVRDTAPPFWAFAWAGGQALARYVLDAPEIVRGKRVLDFAAGSGIVGIAAALAGAREVEAVDVDPLAACACRLNARANRVVLAARAVDLVGERLDGVDVVLAGDVWYEEAPARRFAAWFRTLARGGTRVLSGDPGRAYVPADARALATFEVPTPLDLEGRTSRVSRVLELEP
jgi:predicted nicotinamide N-methyase